MKSGSLNLLEPSEPAQDCNGIVSPLILPSGIDLATFRFVAQCLNQPRSLSLLALPNVFFFFFLCLCLADLPSKEPYHMLTKQDLVTWEQGGHRPHCSERLAGAARCWADAVCFIIIIFTATGLLPDGSGYFTCKQNMKLVTTKFKSGGLHEKHVVATWNLGNHLSICL